MKNFRTLFKYERRMLFPNSKRIDILGAFTSLIFTLAVAGIFGLLVYSIADEYLVLKVQKVGDPIARAYELVNALYTIIIVALGIMSLEKMRSSLTRSSDTPIFLRLPVKSGTIFRAKFMALLLWTYASALLLILPINAIFYFLLGQKTELLIGTLLVYLLLPMVSFLLATILILPYMAIIKFLSTKYFLSFAALAAIVAYAFNLYSGILETLRRLLETGSIKFLFSENFSDTLVKATEITYPANSLASVFLGIDMEISLIISISVAVVALVATFFITAGLYRLVLYRNRDGKKARAKRTFGFRRTIMGSLFRKEFITVYREPKYLFSYFTIAFVMPFMVDCCYALFAQLLRGALGQVFEFALALIVVLVFTILTNTFCATNITRDGKSALKAKAFPIKASKLLFSKVLFCSVISSLSVIASVVVLHLNAGITMDEAIIAGAICLAFSFAQILIATRTDLNHAVVDASPEAVKKASDRTVARVISIGLLLAILIGFVTFFVSVFAGTSPDFLGNFEVLEIYIYVIPGAIALLYLIASIFHYSVNIEKAFTKLTK